jgi:hypothetical protein
MGFTMPAKAEFGLYKCTALQISFRACSSGWPFPYWLQFLSGYPLRRHNMTDVPYLLPKELTHLQIDLMRVS